MSAQSSRAYFGTTDRLAFGSWDERDEALAMALWGDAAVTRLTGGPFDARQVRERLWTEIANQRDHGIQYWPIFRRDTAAFVGCCGLRPRDLAAGVFELGFQLCRWAWGLGYATEAARSVVAWSADRRLTALIAGHHPDNIASRRTLGGLGFAYTHDELYPPTGRIEPCYRLDIGPASSAAS